MKKKYGARSVGSVVVQTTIAGRGRAGRLARAIVASGLAACVQYFPIRSIYRWKGRIESAGEYLLLAKTAGRLAGRLVAYIRRSHSYELPEIVVTRLDGGLNEYLAWIGAETSAKQ